MRLFLVVDETSFYHPAFVEQLLSGTTDEVVGCALVTEVLPKSNLEHYLKRQWRRLQWREMAILAMRKYRSALFNGRSGPGQFHSVEAVLEHHQIDWFEVRCSINQAVTLERIRATQPDVIISSNSLIFGDELLSLPTLCCLNRHSALLPSYGGLWPVFQAYRSGEAYTGVAVHTMERGIDKGVVLSTRQVPIDEQCSLADLYEQCFALSAETVLEALEKVRANDFSSVGDGRTESYFSFPTPEHWQQFRARGGRFV